ncbi:hypothetical protein BDV93DRAFT_607584 [Ceratobasidium sp. AG-I]|nr:hypothetical protein BDV93DRAFT_607584 [Ceratobasidium sp. AG-I]
MSVPSSLLTPNGLYLALHSRPEVDKWHWALYLHVSGALGGYKIHASNIVGPWKVESSFGKEIVNSRIVVLLHRIGILGAPKHQSTINVAEAIPLTLDPMNCRAWTLAAVRALGTHRLLYLKGTIEQLEEETKAAALGYSESVSLGKDGGCTISQVCSESA